MQELDELIRWYRSQYLIMRITVVIAGSIVLYAVIKWLTR